MPKLLLGLGLCPGPRWGAQRSPKPLHIKGPTSMWRGRERIGEGEGREDKRKIRGRRAEETKGRHGMGWARCALFQIPGFVPKLKCEI